MVRETELFESPDGNLSDFCLWGWMNSKVYKTNVDTRDELFTRNLDVAARIKNVKINSDKKTRSSHTISRAY